MGSGNGAYGDYATAVGVGNLAGAPTYGSGGTLVFTKGDLGSPGAEAA